MRFNRFLSSFGNFLRFSAQVGSLGCTFLAPYYMSMLCYSCYMNEQALDPGIKDAVHILRSNGVETFESCEGSKGHAYSEPTVRFHGRLGEGQRALGIAIQAGLKVMELRRVWPVIENEPTGPWWELTFAPTTARASY
jgi:hypothetical protein